MFPFVAPMVRVRALAFALVLPALAPLARGAWDTAFWGAPILDLFRQQQTGNATITYCATAQPGQGPLWFGAAGKLLSFDGKTWRTFAGPSALASLAFNTEGDRLWFGGLGDLGFFDVSHDGQARLTSLRGQLPFPASELKAVRACYPTRDGGAFFVVDDRLLEWTGTKFKVWPYPSAAPRIYPILFEGRLWFHHLESGLYRVGDDGPEKIAGPEQLPNIGLFWLGRENDALVGASNRGFWTISPQPRCLSPDELNAFTAEHRVIGVADLGRGFRAVITFTGGVAIVDRSQKIVRRIGVPDGLRGNIYGHFLGHDGDLWIMCDDGVMRCDIRNATAQIRLSDIPQTNLIKTMTVDADQSVWVGAQNHLYHLTPADGGSVAVQNVSLGSVRNLLTIAPGPNGIWFGGFGGMALHENGQIAQTFDLPGRPLLVIAPLREPHHWLAVLNDRWIELARAASGEWRTTAHPNKPPTTSVAVDAAGRLWTASELAGPQQWVRADGGFALAQPFKEFETADAGPSLAIGRAGDVILFAGRKIYLVRGENAPRLLAEIPGLVTAAAFAPEQARLYVAFRRGADLPSGYQDGIGVVELSRDNAFLRWRDFHVPGLESIGAVRALACTAAAGADTLWIGGSNGLMQARPTELAEWHAPAVPQVTAVTPNHGTTLSFSESLQLHVSSPEITLRPGLRYQTSFGSDNSHWSAPGDRASFEFSNLREGRYSFAVRAVNPAGQASEPTYFTFTILPPWYRSPWAYAGYTTLAGLAVLGAVRYRERRMRARTIELERLVHERTAELEKANAAKDEFLAGMSHEIRNPMNGVVGLSAAIDISSLDHEGQYRFGLLRHCASHLASLLEDILDFSKLQAGTLEIDAQPFSPAELLDAVSAITSPVSAAAGVKVEFALAPAVPPRLIGDARRIRQVLLNYVSNAVKYAPQGTIEVTTWCRAAGPGRTTLTFAVSDEGPGIPPEEQARIFEKFERGAGARSSRIPGTGMGLAVCRRLAEKMGGRAWVESAPGQGSTFFLELELAIATPAAADSPERVLAALPKRALIVDDEEYNLIALSALLERRGFTVRTALNAEQALLGAVEHKPDAIFLDYDMPDTTGPQLARRIRETLQPLGRQPLILATTAYSTVAKREECLAAGMDGFLGKPVVEERLRAAIEEAILRRAPASARHMETPHAEIFDPLENLQMLARQHARTLKAELTEFASEAEAEFATLTTAIAAADPTSSARAAHKISGRFGFLHAAAPMRRALHLEGICRSGEWSTAQRWAEELAHDWTALRDSLARLTGASPE